MDKYDLNGLMHFRRRGFYLNNKKGRGSYRRVHLNMNDFEDEDFFDDIDEEYTEMDEDEDEDMSQFNSVYFFLNEYNEGLTEIEKDTYLVDVIEYEGIYCVLISTYIDGWISNLIPSDKNGFFPFCIVLKSFTFHNKINMIKFHLQALSNPNILNKS